MNQIIKNIKEMKLKCTDNKELDVNEDKLKKFLYFQYLMTMCNETQEQEPEYNESEIDVPFDSNIISKMIELSDSDIFNFCTINKTYKSIDKHKPMMNNNSVVDYLNQNINTTKYFNMMQRIGDTAQGVYYTGHPQITYNKQIYRRFDYSIPFNFYSYQNMEFGKDIEFDIDLEKEKIDIVSEISIVFEILSNQYDSDYTLINNAGSLIIDQIKIDYLDQICGPTTIFNADKNLIDILNRLKFKQVKEYMFKLKRNDRTINCQKIVTLMLTIPLKMCASDFIIANKSNAIKFKLSVSNWEKLYESEPSNFFIHKPKIFRSYVILECKETFKKMNNYTGEQKLITLSPIKMTKSIINMNTASQCVEFNIDKNINLQEFFIIMRSNEDLSNNICDNYLNFLIDCKITSNQNEILFHGTNHLLLSYGPNKFLKIKGTKHNVYYWSFNQLPLENNFNQYLPTSQLADVKILLQFYGFNGLIDLYLIDVALSNYFIPQVI